MTRNVAKLVQVERPRPTPTEPLSADEARQLLTAAAADRHYALWVLMLMLGLRRNEVCGLRWDYVDFTSKSLRITQTVQRVEGKLREMPTKTRRSTRTVPLPSRAHLASACRQAAVFTVGGQAGAASSDAHVYGTRNGTHWSRAT